MTGEIDGDFYCIDDRVDVCKKQAGIIGQEWSDAECRMKCTRSMPKWPTMEQFRNDYGHDYPDEWAVYHNTWYCDTGKSLYLTGRWRLDTRREAERCIGSYEKNYAAIMTSGIVCACTHWGQPPDDWRPE